MQEKTFQVKEEYLLLQFRNPELKNNLISAQVFMEAERICSTERKVKEDKTLSPLQCAMLIALETSRMAGKEAVSSEEWQNALERLLELWRYGFFVPSSEYPFTFEQTIADGMKEEK